MQTQMKVTQNTGVVETTEERERISGMEDSTECEKGFIHRQAKDNLFEEITSILSLEWKDS